MIGTENCRAFLLKMAGYFRSDLRLFWKKNKAGYTRMVPIEIFFIGFDCGIYVGRSFFASKEWELNKVTFYAAIKYESSGTISLNLILL